MSESPPEDSLLPTRESLLGRLRDWEDQEGWQDFFETYWRLIYRVARKSGLNDAEAQDIVQETLVAVARKMPGFRYDPARGSYKGWLLVNVRSRLSEHWRRTATARRRMEPLGNGEGDNTDSGFLDRAGEPDAPELERLWQTEWEQNLVAAAASRVKSKVSSKQFLLYDLAVLKGEPPGAIAHSLNVSIAQVYLARHRVGRLMQAELNRLRRAESA